MDHPLLSIVIPVRNNWVLTRQCLVSLAETNDCDDTEVLVMDNASSDETAEACLPTGQALFGDRFHVLRQYPPQPFATSCNAGAKAAQGDLLFLLNNDTAAFYGWRQPLQQALLDDSSLGAVGPLLLYPARDGFPDTVQHLGIVFNPDCNVNHLYESFPMTHPLVQKKRYFQAITAAALLLSRALFIESGGFYEGFVNGYEDVDFCLRLHQSEKKMTVVPESRFYHFCGQTSGRGANDVANARLLSQRCHHLAKPDKHLFFKEDGYQLKFSLWLCFDPALQPERNFALSRLLRDPKEDTLRQTLEKEPFWKVGYLALSSLLEKQGKYEEALNILVFGTQYWSDPPFLLPMWHLAQKAESNLVETIEKHLQSFVLKPTQDQDRNGHERIKELYHRRTQLRNLDAGLLQSVRDDLDNIDAFLEKEYLPFLDLCQKFTHKG